MLGIWCECEAFQGVLQARCSARQHCPPLHHSLPEVRWHSITNGRSFLCVRPLYFFMHTWGKPRDSDSAQPLVEEEARSLGLCVNRRNGEINPRDPSCLLLPLRRAVPTWRMGMPLEHLQFARLHSSNSALWGTAKCIITGHYRL